MTPEEMRQYQDRIREAVEPLVRFTVDRWAQIEAAAQQYRRVVDDMTEKAEQYANTGPHPEDT